MPQNVDEIVLIRNREPKLISVELIGSSATLEYHQTDDGLELTLPSQSPGKFAYVLRIQTTGTGK